MAQQPSVFIVDIRGGASQWIHYHVTPKNGASSFDYVFVYAFNDRRQREVLWNALGEITQQINGPWFVGWDFNCVMNREERIGALVRSWEMEPIRRCMHYCGLHDIISTGNSFTCNNKQDGQARVFVELDRAMLNKKQEEVNPNVGAAFLNEGEFDHTPVIISAQEGNGAIRKPFKYYTRWKTSPKYEGIIRGCWSENVTGKNLYKVTHKLKLVKQELKGLNKSGFLEIEVEVVRAATAMEEVQRRMHDDPTNRVIADEEVKVLQEFKCKHSAYMSFLKQKAKVAWLRDGDENLALFHQSIKQRRVKNSVYGIYSMTAEWQSTNAGVKQAFLEYYQTLLGT